MLGKQKCAILSVFMLLLFLLTPVLTTATNTTYNDVTINAERTGLELSFDNHELILWNIGEVEDGETKISYWLTQSDLTSEGIKTIDGIDHYELRYSIDGHPVVVDILSDSTGVTVSLSLNGFLKRYADSTLKLSFELDGNGFTNTFENTAPITYSLSMTFLKDVEQKGFLERFQEAFAELFGF